MSPSSSRRDVEKGANDEWRRHRPSLEIHHLAGDLARWSRRHGELLSESAQDRGADLRPAGDRTAEHLTVLAGETTERGEPCSEAGLLLLHDLRRAYLAASENSLNWEMLAQVAQATKDAPLLDMVSSCHPQTLRQIRWANTMIKTLSPQVLTSM